MTDHTPTPRVDDLILAAEAYADKYEGDDRPCIVSDVLNAFYQGAHWAAKDAKRSLAKGTTWIPVRERLPETSELVLGTEGERETTTMYYWPYPTNRAGQQQGKWYYPERTSDLEVRPTHWMPLPEAPK